MKTMTGCIGNQPPVMPYNNYQVSLSAKKYNYHANEGRIFGNPYAT